MSSPDHAAAALTDDVAHIPWKNAPLPQIGRRVELRTMHEMAGKNRSVTVRGHVLFAAVSEGVLRITLAGSEVEYLLPETSLLARWHYLDAAPESAPVALMSPPSDEEATPFDESEEPDATDAGPLSITDVIREYIKLDARIAAIKAELKVLEPRKATLSDQCVELMIEHGMDSPPGVDGMTAYLTPIYHVEKLVNPETGEPFAVDEVIEALRACGYGEAMIKEGYNGNQLRSLLREFKELGQDPPEALAAVVKLASKRELRVTVASATKRRAAPSRPAHS